VDARAVILAGGEGTRLRPLTVTRPKPIVPLLNRPFLEYQLALLRQHGVTDIVLSCSYRVEDVRAAMGTGARAGVALRYAVEATPLGTAGGIRNAAEPGRGRLVVLNGDILTDADLGALLAFHEARGARTTIGLTAVDDPARYGLVETDPDGRIRRFVEKPRPEQITTRMVNAGIYVIEADLLSRIATDRPVSIERETFPALLADGIPCYGAPLGGYWRDIGTPAAYREAQVDLLQGRVATALTPAGLRRGGCWVGPGSTIDPTAVLHRPALLGAGVAVESAAVVGPLTVLGDGCRIAAGARVEGAVLWERVAVDAEAVLAGCVVGADARIGAGSHLGPGVALESGAVVPPRARLSA
jgi:NDP-sugar pyrophosphorylase family protein